MIRRRIDRGSVASVRRALSSALVALAFLSTEPGIAETVADKVRSHVSDNLDKPDTKPPPKKKARKHSKPRRSRAGPPVSGVTYEDEAEPEEEEPEEKGPKIPQRVIGPNLRLDPKVGAGYRGWILQPYPAVDVSAQGYFTWSFEMKATLFRWVNLHRGYFESNGLSAPRHSGAVVAAEVGKQAPKAAWFLGVVGVPITRAWEPIIRYEARAFRATATPNRPVRIVRHDTADDADLDTIPLTDGPLVMVSGFETLVAGVQYSHGKDASAVIEPGKVAFPPIYFGLGLISYSKPYQVTVGDAVLDDLLFDARFRGAGLAFGMELPAKPDAFFVEEATQLGLGEVELYGNVTLNELLPQTKKRTGLTPPEWLIGYLQGDVTVGYTYTLLRTKPSVLLSGALTGGGATFFYFKTQTEQGEQVEAPPLNWDFLWGVRAAVTIPL